MSTPDTTILKAEIDKLRALLAIVQGQATVPSAKSSVIWNPAAPMSYSNVFKTWTEVYDQIVLANGAIEVLCAAEQNCTIQTRPSELTSTYDVMGASFGVWGAASGGTTLSLLDNTTILNPSQFDGQILVDCQAASVPNISFDFPAGFDRQVVLANGAQIQGDGTLEPIDIPDNGTLSLICYRGGGLGNYGVAPVKVEAVGIFNLYALVGAKFPSLHINGAPVVSGTGTFNLFYDASLDTGGDPLITPANWYDGNPPAGIFTGTYNAIPIDNAAYLNPSQGPTASRPTGALTGQMYFDTTLAAGAGKPIWWNGATWVDATGTPA